MTEYTTLEDKKEKKEKKDTVLERYWDSTSVDIKGWHNEHSIFKKIIYVGKSTKGIDRFVGIYFSGRVGFFEGIKGDEFD